MKLLELLEARLAQARQWKPKTMTEQWLDLADVEKMKRRWSVDKLQDYQNFVQWIQRHEDQLNNIYQNFVHGWDEFKLETEPHKIMFDDDFEYEHDWDWSDFNPRDQFRNTKAYEDLTEADDFRDDWFEEVLDWMAIVIME